jgi:hypothetical protein
VVDGKVADDVVVGNITNPCAHTHRVRARVLRSLLPAPLPLRHARQQAPLTSQLRVARRAHPVRAAVGPSGLVCGLFISPASTRAGLGARPRLPRVLGVYTGAVCTSVDNADAQTAQAHAPDTQAYTFDLDFVAPDAVPSRYDAHAATGEAQSLMVNARAQRNEVAFINDARGAASGVNALAEPNPRLRLNDEARVNVRFVNVAVDGLPYVLAVQIKHVAPGGELLCDYGENYWRCMRRAYATKRAIERLVQAALRRHSRRHALHEEEEEEEDAAPAAADDIDEEEEEEEEMVVPPAGAAAAAAPPAPAAAAGGPLLALPSSGVARSTYSSGGAPGSWQLMLLQTSGDVALRAMRSDASADDDDAADFFSPRAAGAERPHSASRATPRMRAGSAATTPAAAAVTGAASAGGGGAPSPAGGGAGGGGAAAARLDAARVALLQLDGSLPPVDAVFMLPFRTSLDLFLERSVRRWRSGVVDAHAHELPKLLRRYAAWLAPRVLRADWAAALPPAANAAALVAALRSGIDDDAVAALWAAYDADLLRDGGARYELDGDATWHTTLSVLVLRTRKRTARGAANLSFLNLNMGADWRDGVLAALQLRDDDAGGAPRAARCAAPPDVAARLLRAVRTRRRGGLLDVSNARASRVCRLAAAWQCVHACFSVHGTHSSSPLLSHARAAQDEVESILIAHPDAVRVVRESQEIQLDGSQEELLPDEETVVGPSAAAPAPAPVEDAQPVLAAAGPAAAAAVAPPPPPAHHAGSKRAREEGSSDEDALLPVPHRARVSGGGAEHGSAAAPAPIALPPPPVQHHAHDDAVELIDLTGDSD